MDRLEALLIPGERVSITKKVENRLGPEESARMLVGIRELRRLLPSFMERFDLRRRRVDVRRVLSAELSTAWVMLEDCRPKRMKGYGVKFDDHTREELDESVDQFLAELVALRQRVR